MTRKEILETINEMEDEFVQEIVLSNSDEESKNKVMREIIKSIAAFITADWGQICDDFVSYYRHYWMVCENVEVEPIVKDSETYFKVKDVDNYENMLFKFDKSTIVALNEEQIGEDDYRGNILIPNEQGNWMLVHYIA